MVERATKTVSVPSAGMAISQTVTCELTYLVPRNAQVGTALDSGVSFGVSGFATTQTFNPMGVNATIRGLNPGEAAATGSSELGFGSSDGGVVIVDPNDSSSEAIFFEFSNGAEHTSIR